jgi:hypothetical protein
LWFGLRLRCYVVIVMMFVVVMRGNGNAAAHQGESAEGSQSGLIHRVRRKRLCGGNFRCQFVFAKGGDGVIVQPAVCLCANQRTLSLAEIVVDDQVSAIIKGDIKVITLTIGNQLLWPYSARGVRKLVVGAMHGLNMLRRSAGIQRVGGKGVAGGVFQSQGDVGHNRFPGDFSV